jgi:hypothetical protein
LFVRVTRNSLRKYPSEPITSTPSYPASRARTPHLTNARICRSTPRAESARGVNGEIGDLTRDGATASGVYPYRPEWRIWSAIFPPWRGRRP